MSYSSVGRDDVCIGVILLLGSLLLPSSGCTPIERAPAPVEILNSQRPPPVKPEYYDVQAGDTLFGIAWYTGYDYQRIAAVNNIAPPYALNVGQRLRLPGFATATTPAPVTPVAKSKTTAPTAPVTVTTAVKPVKKNTVDPSANAAYGDVKKPKPPATTSPVGAFPTAVSVWHWPSEGNVIRTFSSSETGFKGIDIAAPVGSAAVSAAMGKVVYVGNALRGYGNLVIIKHTDAMLSAYAHLDSFKVKEQQWVQAGDVIGTVGSTGTDSPKLHFEVRYRGKATDPLKYLPKR